MRGLRAKNGKLGTEICLIEQIHGTGRTKHGKGNIMAIDHATGKRRKRPEGKAQKRGRPRAVPKARKSPSRRAKKKKDDEDFKRMWKKAQEDFKKGSEGHTRQDKRWDDPPAPERKLAPADSSFKIDKKGMRRAMIVSEAIKLKKLLRYRKGI